MNPASASSIKEIRLKKNYSFMYENFVLSSQNEVFLLLESDEQQVSILKFSSTTVYKFGYPNDEVSHPLENSGLGSYGFYEVSNSGWLKEIIKINQHHHRHSDEMFFRDKHFIAKFKDVTFEIIAINFEEVTMSVAQLLDLVKKEITQ